MPSDSAQGYKAFRISTIVDYKILRKIMKGYKAFRISTIVDYRSSILLGPWGYKAFRISTIVDFKRVGRMAIVAIKPLEFLLL